MRVLFYYIVYLLYTKSREMSSNINDLKITNEILPLFNYTLNDVTKSKLLETFHSPKKSIEEIYFTQNVIKGFIQNLENVNEYNYSKIYFHQVYDFLKKSNFNELNLTKLDLLLSPKLKKEIQSKLIPILFIFDKIYHQFLTKLDIDLFPDLYKKDILTMIDFISPFTKENYSSKNLNKIGDLLKFTRYILFRQSEFNAFYKLLFQAEIYLSLAKGIIKNKFVFPEFTSETILFENIYHPLLKNAVANDVSISKNIVLLTGPNMSGKSTFLKSIFISIYLGHIGLGVPAKSAKFPLFDYFSISINHNDDLKNGYSHFMNEIISLKNSLLQHKQGKKCFVIFDELFKGTNIEDALEISSKTIKGLLKSKDSFFFISTHLHLLNELEEIKLNKTANFYIESIIENQQPIFTYKIKEGWSDLKIGQLLFDNEGLNDLLK